MKTETISVKPKISNVPNLIGFELSKILVSNATKGFLGDGTLQSGILKFGAGMGLEKVIPNSKGITGDIKNYLIAGLVLDGVEDLSIGIYNTFLNGKLNIPFINQTTSNDGLISGRNII